MSARGVLAMSAEKSLAEKLFDAMHVKSLAEEEVTHALLIACGIGDDPDDWPLEDITFDWYDASFEFKKVKGDWLPTDEQFAACFALGFSRCWICYSDGREVYRAR